MVLVVIVIVQEMLAPVVVPNQRISNDRERALSTLEEEEADVRLCLESQGTL